MSASGETTIDFGAFPGSNEASVTVIGQAGILTGSQVDAWIVAKATSDHTTNDHAYAGSLMGITCGAPTAGVGFTIYARSPHKMQGTFTVQWAWA